VSTRSRHGTQRDCQSTCPIASIKKANRINQLSLLQRQRIAFERLSLRNRVVREAEERVGARGLRRRVVDARELPAEMLPTLALEYRPRVAREPRIFRHHIPYKVDLRVFISGIGLIATRHEPRSTRSISNLDKVIKLCTNPDGLTYCFAITHLLSREL
jgi:hypothetical protein